MFNSTSKPHSLSGLTLVELIIASTIGIMMLVMTANLTVSVFKTRSQLQNLNEVQQSATVILQDLKDNIRWSQDGGIEITADFNQLKTTKNDIPTTYSFDSTNKQILKGTNILNSPKVQITGLKFEQTNTAISAYYLPLVRIQFTISSSDNSNIVLTPDITFSQKRTRYGPTP